MYSGAIGLSRFENEEYLSCFAIRGIHVFRAKNMQAALSVACLSLQPFTGGMSSAELLIISV